MKTLPKVFLLSSVLTFSLGLTGPGSEVWYGIFQPLGALLFISFFITNLVSRLDPEQYRADNRLCDTLLGQSKPKAGRGASAEPDIAKEALHRKNAFRHRVVAVRSDKTLLGLGE